MKRVLPWLVVGMLGLNACGMFDSKTKPAKTEEQKAFGDTGIPPQLRSRGGDGTAVTPGGNKHGTATLDFTPMEDIWFTNPDDPDAQVPELAALLAAPKTKPKIWEESDTISRSRSAREGKPLLILFTNSQNNSMCKALDEELLSTSNFEKWAAEKLVRMRVDATVSVKDDALSVDEAKNREADIKTYVALLKKRYKVLTYPTLILLNPGGEVLGRYPGYKSGTADFTWGLLKHGESVSTRAYAAWRAEMEKKGYREWQDRQGRKVFAKLVSYAKGELILIEPDGSRSRTHEDKLSDADRAWITEQKNLHNMP